MTNINNNIQNFGKQNVSQPKYDKEYLEEIEKYSLTRMDEEGNKDGKATVDEALNDLDIGSILSGQNILDTAKIAYAAKDIEKALYWLNLKIQKKQDMLKRPKDSCSERVKSRYICSRKRVAILKSFLLIHILKTNA